MYDIDCLTKLEPIDKKGENCKTGVEIEEVEYRVCDPYDCNPDVFD